MSVLFAVDSFRLVRTGCIASLVIPSFFWEDAAAVGFRLCCGRVETARFLLVQTNRPLDGVRGSLFVPLVAVH